MFVQKGEYVRLSNAHPVFQQLELQFVPRILPVRGELAVHHVDGVCTLIGRQTDAAPEK
jgi:hypothetical protein